MRRSWFLAFVTLAGCGDSGGGGDGGDTETDTETDTTGGSDTTGTVTVGSSPSTVSGNPTTLTTVTITSITTETDTSTTTGPIVPGAYVHATLGADSNPGTPLEPVRTIARGIGVAAEEGFDFVYVAAGDYFVASDTGDIVEVVDGISIRGGYAPDDWEVNNPSVFVSRLVDTAVQPAGFHAADPHRALHVGPEVGPETRIEGLTIEASAAPNSAAVVVEGVPVIVRSTLLGGGGGYSTALYIAGGAPRVFASVLDGVGSPEPQPAFAVRGVDCAPNFQTSVLYSGGGTNNRAVFLQRCGGRLATGVVVAERGLGGSARAIEMVDSTTDIVSNTLVVDPETAGYFIIALGVGAPSIVASNNFVTPVEVPTWCYRHVDALDVATFRNNNVGCTNLYGGSSVFYTIPELQAGHADASGNVDVEPGVVDPASDWHLRGDGTVLCAVARGGADVGIAAANDVEGFARTEPWSIGAYELDTGCL